MLKISPNTLFHGVITALLLLLMLTTPILSQKKKVIPKAEARPRAVACALTIDEAPRLRGFFLNQSEAEITAVLPSFHKAYEIARNELMPDRELISDFREVRSERLDQDLTTMDEYSDVSFVWQLWGGRVVQLQVTYEEYEPMNMNDFLEQVSSTTGLPLKAFHVTDKHTAIAKCDGFSIVVREGSVTKKGWVPEESQVTLSDAVAFAAIDAEEKQLRKERAEEEARKKAEAEKKKRTFKP